jgi:tight adherence protein C
LIILVAVTVFLATTIGIVVLFWWWEARKESLSRRIKEVTASGGEHSGSAFDLVTGWISGIRARVSARTPFREEEIIAIVTGKELSGGRLLLNHAGYRTMVAYQVYWIVRVILPLLLGFLAFGYGRAVGMPVGKFWSVFFAGVALGVILPDFILRRKIGHRQEEITDALPDGLDLLVVCVEAGLGINAAFVKITEEFQLTSPILSEEFDIVNREMVAGKPRQEALRALSDRTGVEDVKSLVAMLIQTERLGTSLAQSLRVHSDSLRTRRRQRAEESAAKTTTKLIFPLAFLLFPAMFVVMLGPGVIQILRVLLPVLKGGR